MSTEIFAVRDAASSIETFPVAAVMVISPFADVSVSVAVPEV
jgi:hypothetical protein